MGAIRMRLSDEAVDRIVQRRGLWMALGLGCIALGMLLPKGWGAGWLTGFMLLSLSLYGYCFRRWRTESGVWMLALLLVVTLGPCWLYFEWLLWDSIVRANPGLGPNRVQVWDRVRWFADGAFALMVFSRTVRLALSVAIGNWERCGWDTGRWRN